VPSTTVYLSYEVAMGILLHELAHCKHTNHGSTFKAFEEQLHCEYNELAHKAQRPIIDFGEVKDANLILSTFARLMLHDPMVVLRQVRSGGKIRVPRIEVT